MSYLYLLQSFSPVNHKDSIVLSYRHIEFADSFLHINSIVGLCWLMSSP
jgi:hypothetical protein